MTEFGINKPYRYSCNVAPDQNARVVSLSNDGRQSSYKSEDDGERNNRSLRGIEYRHNIIRRYYTLPDRSRAHFPTTAILNSSTRFSMQTGTPMFVMNTDSDSFVSFGIPLTMEIPGLL